MLIETTCTFMIIVFTTFKMLFWDIYSQIACSGIWEEDGREGGIGSLMLIGTTCIFSLKRFKIPPPRQSKAFI